MFDKKITIGNLKQEGIIGTFGQENIIVLFNHSYMHLMVCLFKTWHLINAFDEIRQCNYIMLL